MKLRKLLKKIIDNKLNKKSVEQQPDAVEPIHEL